MQLAHLQILNLSNNNHLKTLPLEFASLRGLVHLRLSRCNLTSVPPVLLQMTQLEELKLACNPISSLPDELAGLVGLKRLHVDCCQLAEFPRVLTRLPRLEFLDLHGNYHISALPDADVTAMPKLEILDISDCQIRLSDLQPFANSGDALSASITVRYDVNVGDGGAAWQTIELARTAAEPEPNPEPEPAQALTDSSCNPRKRKRVQDSE
jgi:hypothetical protein